MIVDDRIYGRIRIKDKVIEDLIESGPFQRLRGISQDGAPHFIQPVRNVTRYEHSIGVWYLSYLYNRPIEEQIASLLHDLPHTAFSHVIDFVMNDSRHEFHEKFTNKIILDSEIPEILKKHKVDIQKVLNKKNYDLLENDLPDISVDRWDYFMRDGFTFKLLSRPTIKLFLNSIKEKDKTFYFEDLRVASEFAILFINFSRLVWLDPTSHGSFFLLSEAIKQGLKEKVITQEDYFLTDMEVIDKLRNSSSDQINNYLDRLKENRHFIYAPEETAEFFGANKPRYVDPYVLVDNELKRVSELIPGMREYFEEFVRNYKYLGVKQILS